MSQESPGPATDGLIEEILSRWHALPNSRVPQVRPLRREISRRLTQAAPAQVIGLARRTIIEEPGLRWFAYELAHHHRPTLRSLEGVARNPGPR